MLKEVAAVGSNKCISGLNNTITVLLSERTPPVVTEYIFTFLILHYSLSSQFHPFLPWGFIAGDSLDITSSCL